MALTFFLDNKPVLIDHVGGYSGCPDEMTKKKTKYGTKVTILNFCYGCMDFSKYSENFIKIFNNRTEKLLLSSIKH